MDDKIHPEDQKTASFIYPFLMQACSNRWLESPTRHHNAIPSLANAPVVFQGDTDRPTKKTAGWTMNAHWKDSRIVACIKNCTVGKNSIWLLLFWGVFDGETVYVLKMGQSGHLKQIKIQPNNQFIQTMQCSRLHLKFMKWSLKYSSSQFLGVLLDNIQALMNISL